MRRGAKAAVVMLAVFLLGSCNAVRQQKSLRPAPDTSEFKNLRVLPRDIAKPQLIETMRGFSNALNVHCDHCHVRVSGSDDEFDFPSDARKAKKTARAMIEMTRRINSETIVRVNPMSRPVTCLTCHRGKLTPEGTG